MADITITIPDNVVGRVLDAFAVVYNWDISNGQTQAQFAKSQVEYFIKGVVKQHEASIAAEVARIAAIESVDSDISLT